jgi:ubiquinone/menaquinone biosynthesis C-methylase UbiE
MPKIEPFERYSEKYEDWFGKNKFAYQSELLAVKALIPENSEGIEVGVGSGKFAEPLGIKLGVEPSKEMGRIAEKRGINILDTVAEKLPFNDAQFGFVLMVTTICFLDDIKAAFGEAYRVLKPGGCFIIGFVDKLSPLGKLYQLHKMKNVFYRIANFYSVDEVVSYLKEAGFENFAFVQTIFHNLGEIKEIEPIKEGYGEGSFVVIRAGKGKT